MEIIKKMNPSKEEDEQSCCPKMSLKERMIGFAICFGIGLLIQLMSFGSFVGVLAGKPTKFAVMFTLGNVISLLGTMFLSGPAKQLKNMTDKTRLITSIVYVISMIMTFVTAFIIKIMWLLIVFLIIQTIAYMWYTLSQIPYGRTVVKQWLKSCFS